MTAGSEVGVEAIGICRATRGWRLDAGSVGSASGSADSVSTNGGVSGGSNTRVRGLPALLLVGVLTALLVGVRTPV